MPSTMTATQVFATAFDQIKKQWKGALIIVALGYCVELLIGLAVTPVSLLLGVFNGLSTVLWPLLPVAFVGFLALGYGVSVLLYALEIPLLRATGWLIDGRNPTLEEGWQHTTVHYKRYLLISAWQTLFHTLWGLLFIVPGIIKYYEYFVARLLTLDYQQLDYKQALKLSMQVTNGFKGRLFALSLLQMLVVLAGALLICTVVAPLAATALYMALKYYCTVIVYRDIRTVAIQRGQLPPLA